MLKNKEATKARVTYDKLSITTPAGERKIFAINDSTNMIEEQHVNFRERNYQQDVEDTDTQGTGQRPNDFNNTYVFDSNIYVAWNIRGLWSSWQNPDFMAFIQKFHVIGLVETQATDVNLFTLDGFCMFRINT